MRKLFSALREQLQNILTALLLLVCGTYVFFHSTYGTAVVHKFIEKRLSVYTSADVCIDHFEFDSQTANGKGIHMLFPSGSTIHIDSVHIEILWLDFFKTFNIDCKFTNIEVPKLPTLQLHASLNFDRGNVAWNGVIFNQSTPSARELIGVGSFQLKTLWGVPFALDQHAPLNAHVEASLPLALYGQPFLSKTLFLTGYNSTICDVTGSLHEPILRGSGSIRDGYCESLISGAVFSGLTASYVFDNHSLKVLSFKGADHNGGYVQGHGKVKFMPELSYLYAVNLLNANLIHTDIAHGSFSGSLLCKGNLSQAEIKGDLVANTFNVSLPDHSSKEVEALNVVYINKEKPSAEFPITPQEEKNFPLLLDLQTSFPNPIPILSNNLQSMWKGSIHITGDSDKPACVGEWHLENGKYLFKGKQWDLTSGVIVFKGEKAKKSSLYAKGKAAIGNIDVETVIKGSFDDLEIAFSSSPALTQKEILCHILFGHPLREISSLQGVELDQSANKLQSKGSDAFDAISKIKECFGIDRLDVVHGTGVDAQDLSLKIGSYVLPRVFLGVRKNFSSNAHGIEIEADIIDNVKLQAQIDNDNDKQIHLKWKKDY